jgi:glycosyltransferase involved in cell wall biosynthesis
LADHIIAVSEYNKKLLINYGIEPEKISVISNGIKLTSAKKNMKLREDARAILGLKSSETLVIGLGVSIYRKGVDLFVDIAEKMLNVRFIWIGKRFSTAFLSHSSFLKKKFAQAIKMPNCQFAGYVSYKTLIGLFNAADIFLFPTREENQGIAFLEAILYGKPAVISDHPVFAEFQAEVHCLKASTSDQYVYQIERLIKDPTLCEYLVKNARDHLKNHDITLSIKKIATLYSQVLQKK